MKWLITILIGVLLMQAVSARTFDIKGELIYLEPFAEFDGERFEVAYEKATISSEKFGYTYDETYLKDLAALQGKREVVLGFELNMTGYQVSNSNPYVFERDMGFTEPVRNQIGQIEERRVKRYLDLKEIFSKQANINGNYEFIHITEETEEVEDVVCIEFDKNGECIKEDTQKINVTRNIDRWIAKFFNLFDLDPEFIDDTQSEWELGTISNFNILGFNSKANLSTTRPTGYFTSKIYDSAGISSWDNVSMSANALFGSEIGLNNLDSMNPESPLGVNTSGLVLLMHFNNESIYGENNSQFMDFSNMANPTKSSHVNNGNCSGSTTACPTYSSNNAFGAKSLDFESTESDYVHIANNYVYSNSTISAWINSESFPAVGTIVDSDLDDMQLMVKTNGVVSFWSDFGAGGFGCDDSSATGLLRTNQWHHVVAVMDTTGTSALLYVDGALVLTVDCSSGTPIASQYLHIGASTSDGGGSHDEFFDGLIDEVAIWNRTLSADEIKNLYLRGAMRLNISARSCNDPLCAGETFTRVANGTFPNVSLNLDNNRYFQYNLSYSDNSSSLNAVVSNITIDYTLLETVKAFIDTNEINFSLGSFSNTNVSSAGENGNLTLNFTVADGISNPQYNLSGNFTSRAYDSGFTNTSWRTVEFTKQMPIGTDIMALPTISPGGSTSNMNITALFRNGTHTNEIIGRNINNITNFTGSSNSYSIPDGFSYGDILGCDGDKDSTNLIVCLMRNGSTISTLTLPNGSLNYSLVFSNISTFVLPSGINNSMIMGMYIDSSSTQTALYLFNRTLLRASQEIPPYTFNTYFSYVFNSNANWVSSPLDIVTISFGESGAASRVIAYHKNTSLLSDDSQSTVSATTFGNMKSGNLLLSNGQNITESTNITLFAQVSNDSIAWSTPTEITYTGQSTYEVGRYARYSLKFFTPDKYLTGEFDEFKWSYVDGVNAASEGDTISPIMNGTFNISLSQIFQDSILNATFNATDETNLTNITITFNGTGITELFNFSINGTGNGLGTYQRSQAFTISQEAGSVINISGIAFDNSSNVKYNTTIFTVQQAGDSCTCPISGDWEIDDGSICELNIGETCNLGSNCIRVNNGGFRNNGGTLRAGCCFVAVNQIWYAGSNTYCGG